jgi:exopolyphosphatase / guanosine-5'-triphosphate,3'-diphosphate pyrophosphatase
MARKARRMAAIDVGSNSIHMIVVEPRGRSYRVLDKEKEIVQLARGSLGGEPLTSAAMERGVASLGRMAEIARRWDARDIVAVATSAVREAPNGGDFIRMAEQASGIRIGVISGEEEADFIYRAARLAVDFHGQRAVVIDIGGGSIEIVLGTEHEVYFTHSDPLGAIRLAEKFFRYDPPLASEISACRRHVRRTLRRTLFQVSAIGFDFCLGTSGTINTLATISDTTVADPGVASGLKWLEREVLEELVKKLSRLPAQERVATFGIDPARGETILSGGLALLEILIALNVRKLRACSAALREGLVDAWFEKRNMKRESVGGVRLSAVIDLAEQSGYDGAHARHVANLALSIFDQTAALHGYDQPERELLEYSALLHEVGMQVSFRGHHRHSYYLIRHSGLQGFTTDQVRIMANVARYYRKALPSLDHDNYVELSERLRSVVDVLAAILRIAAGLDRGRRQAVESVRVDIGRKRLQFFVTERLDASLEIEGARRKAGFFGKIFDRKVVVDAERFGIDRQ